MAQNAKEFHFAHSLSGASFTGTYDQFYAMASRQGYGGNPVQDRAALEALEVGQSIDLDAQNDDAAIRAFRELVGLNITAKRMS